MAPEVFEARHGVAKYGVTCIYELCCYFMTFCGSQDHQQMSTHLALWCMRLPAERCLTLSTVHTISQNYYKRCYTEVFVCCNMFEVFAFKVTEGLRPVIPLNLKYPEEFKVLMESCIQENPSARLCRCVFLWQCLELVHLLGPPLNAYVKYSAWLSIGNVKEALY